MRESKAKLQGSVQVVVGTLNRVFDLIKRSALQTDCIRILYLDSADETLSSGFKGQIYELFQPPPSDTQVVLSATTPTDDLEVAMKFMRDPV